MNKAYLAALLLLAHVPSAHSATGPYISSISPKIADKEGGTSITVYGAGFTDTPDLKAKFSRMNPDTDQVVEVETMPGDCVYKSATEIVCQSPRWDEARCVYCDYDTFSTCPQVNYPTDATSCTNRYPRNIKNIVADVRNDGVNLPLGIAGTAHYEAEHNHHHHAGIVGAKGMWPCPSCANEWHATDNPNGQHPIGFKIRNGVATTFYGHTGSPYLRSDDYFTDTEVNRGSFIKIRNQFFTIVRIERCEEGEVGCFCSGQSADWTTAATKNDGGTWSNMQLATNNSGVETIAAYPIGPLATTKRNNAMYEFDKDPKYWENYGHMPTCAGGHWKKGTKITLDQPIYRVGGTPNEEFWTNNVYVSSKKPCVDCKCAEGCALTMSVTNDGKMYSGGGTNGQTWHGSAVKFTAKHLVPEVFKITFPDLKGARDSSRMFVPATGNTRIRVHGKNFQPTPMLRCYFDSARLMVKAEFIDENTVECLTPAFVARHQDLLSTTLNDNQCADHSSQASGQSFVDGRYYFAPDISDTTGSSRLFDSTCTDSKQSGAAVFMLDGAQRPYAYSHVQVTNNGMVRDLSVQPHKRADGALSYIEEIGSDHRSTCYQLEYPSAVISPTFVGTDQTDAAVPPGYEQSEPCRKSHLTGEAEGNDIQIKYATCYEAQSAKDNAMYPAKSYRQKNANYYGSTELAGEAQTPNATHSLGQIFRIPAEMAGPLVAVDLHLKKERQTAPEAACWDPVSCAAAARRETTLEVCISAGGFAGGVHRVRAAQQQLKAQDSSATASDARDPSQLGAGTGAPQITPSADAFEFDSAGQILSCEQITVQHIKNTSDVYTVYFTKTPYLLGYYEYANGHSCGSTADSSSAGFQGANCAGFDSNTFYQEDVSGGTPTAAYNGGRLRAHPTNAQASGNANYNDIKAEYYLTLSWISGPTEVSWAMSDQNSLDYGSGASMIVNEHTADGNKHGYLMDWRDNRTVAVGTSNSGFRSKFYTCDGCRWQYISDSATDDSHQIGAIYGRQNESETYLKTYPSARCTSELAQVGGRPHAHLVYDTAEGLPRQNQAEDPTGAKGDECGTPTYREQFAQAIRPTEDITLTKMKTRMRAAFQGYNTMDPTKHDDRTASGDFVSADGATVSTWITRYGKMGEYVCTKFGGTTQVQKWRLQGDEALGTDSGWNDDYHDGNSMVPGGAARATTGQDDLIGCGTDNKNCMTCDINNDGVFSELCFLGALCNRSLTDTNGGCGDGGVCAMAEVVENAHYLRNHPAGNGPITSSCGEDLDCDNSQMLKVSHSTKIQQATAVDDWQDIVWEFENPVVLDKHTTYYVNFAIDETISNSDSVYWYGGPSGNGEQYIQDLNGQPQFSRHQFLGAYKRTNVVVDGMMKFVWLHIPNYFFNLEIMRCVTALPMITSFSTSGEGTGTCSARSSSRGGIDGPMITFTGKNFFPSKNLRVVFLDHNGQMGPHAECETTKNDFTEMQCKAPSFDPFAGHDCSVPGACSGVHVMPTNDGVNYGPELFSPKFYEPYTECVAYKSPTGFCSAAVPASINASHHDFDHHVQLLGKNQLKYCFSDVHVSVSGDDFRGDGTEARPFRTIQRGVDACNPHDVIVLHPGTYTGTGNRGLRHMGKKIEVVSIEDGPSHRDRSVAAYSNHHAHVSYRDQTIIDCEHYPDGHVLNNNKDSDSPHAGFMDFSGVTTRNCENLRVYY